MLDRSSWNGFLDGFTASAPNNQVVTFRERARGSAACAFLAIADDGNAYYVKVPRNPQGTIVLVNEVLVTNLASLIKAPMRPQKLLSIRADLAQSWKEFPVAVHDGLLIVANGSLLLESAIDEDRLAHTTKDDNENRQARLLAMWDWCLGGDPQWLYDGMNDKSIWSFDHGFWFATESTAWDDSALETLVDVDWTWSESKFPAVSASELNACADDLLKLTAEEIASACAKVPLEWGIPRDSLETLAWFVYVRRISVANRLKIRASEEKIISNA